MQLMNVVNENETKWTHFRLIIHPAQVKRSGGVEEKRRELWLKENRKKKTCWATAVN